MLCGPPATLTKRTVLPGAIVSALGSNFAWVVPLPIILTSTTGPVGAAGVVVVAAAGCGAEVSAAFLPHAAMTVTAASAPIHVSRIVSLLVSRFPGQDACELVHNIDPVPTNGRPAGPEIGLFVGNWGPGSCIFGRMHELGVALRRHLNSLEGAVRKLLAIAALAAFTTSTAAAQSRWTPEIGIQGGYNHMKPAGTGANDAINIITVPGASFITAVYGSGAFFAIIPAGQKLAIEPQFGFSQVETGGSHATIAKIGLRADYALNANVYGAVGGALNYVEQGATPTHPALGAQVAVGYRTPMTAALD